MTLERLEGTAWFDAVELSDLVRVASRIRADAALALHWGGSMPVHVLPLVGSLLVHAPSLRVAISDLRRYAWMAVLDSGLSLRETHATAVLSFDMGWQDREPLMRCCELVFSWAAALARSLLGSAVAPSEIRLPYPAPQHESEYTGVFRCPVRFGAERAELVFDRALLDERQPCFEADAYLALREAAEALRLRAHTQPIHTRVRALLRQNEPLLTDGDIEHLSASLSVTQRRLRRALSKEGTSFASLRDQVRRERALFFLGETELTIKEIIARLGYSEPSPFYRAFKRWTGGMTPVDYRSRALGPGR
jgi:AraC-like DNA-binding protein